jgi:copper chaperone
MAQTDTTTTDYLVTGMTCGHCVSSVIEEVSQISGVRSVTVDLVVGAASTVHVTGDAQPALDDIRLAIDEAGYALDGPVNRGPAA